MARCVRVLGISFDHMQWGPAGIESPPPRIRRRRSAASADPRPSRLLAPMEALGIPEVCYTGPRRLLANDARPRHPMWRRDPPTMRTTWAPRPTRRPTCWSRSVRSPLAADARRHDRGHGGTGRTARDNWPLRSGRFPRPAKRLSEEGVIGTPPARRCALRRQPRPALPPRRQGGVTPPDEARTQQETSLDGTSATRAGLAPDYMGYGATLAPGTWKTTGTNRGHLNRGREPDIEVTSTRWPCSSLRTGLCTNGGRVWAPSRNPGRSSRSQSAGLSRGSARTGRWDQPRPTWTS
jgi:hypothetical protein